MAQLSDQSIVARVQQRESHRLSNVSSRLTRAETERLDALAKKRGQQRGEFIRALILNALAYERDGCDPVLTETVGIQLLLMNVLKPIATGQPLTATAFDSIVAEVHKVKKSVAHRLIEEEK